MESQGSVGVQISYFGHNFFMLFALRLVFDVEINTTLKYLRSS
jgi:hypothetical protein